MFNVYYCTNHQITILHSTNTTSFERPQGGQATHMAVSYLLSGYVGTVAYNARWEIL